MASGTGLSFVFLPVQPQAIHEGVCLFNVYTRVESNRLPPLSLYTHGRLACGPYRQDLWKRRGNVARRAGSHGICQQALTTYNTLEPLTLVNTLEHMPRSSQATLRRSCLGTRRQVFYKRFQCVSHKGHIPELSVAGQRACCPPT